MIVDKDFLIGVRTTFQAEFDKIQGLAPMDWTQFTTVIDSLGKKTLTFSWLGTPPMLRTIKGTLEFGKAFEHNYTITVTDNGVGIEIGEDQFMSDPLGTISLFVSQMMTQAAKYEMKIAAETLSDGFSTNGFDGVSFFNASHSYGDSATHDNLDTAVLTNLITGPYQTGWQTINTAEGDDGEPMSLVPTDLLVHSNNRAVVRQLFHAEMISQTTNVAKGDMREIVTPFLKTGTEWIMMAADLPLKPVIMVEQMAKRFVAQDGLDSDNAFERNVFRYKVDNKMSTGYGDPRSSYGSDGTV